MNTRKIEINYPKQKLTAYVTYELLLDNKGIPHPRLIVISTYVTKIATIHIIQYLTLEYLNF